MLRAAFKLPLRQTEGLMASVLTSMHLTISVSLTVRHRDLSPTS